MVSLSTLWRRKQAGDPDYRERTRAYGRAYRALNKNRVNARRRKRRRERRRTDRAFREWHRNYHNKHRYGLSQSDYEEWLARQGGVCAICGRTCTRRLAVDHCHASGEVRGLLCIKCNLGLGMYDDDTERLRKAIGYLESSRCDPDPQAIHDIAEETRIPRSRVHRVKKKLERDTDTNWAADGIDADRPVQEAE